MEYINRVFVIALLLVVLNITLNAQEKNLL